MSNWVHVDEQGRPYIEIADHRYTLTDIAALLVEVDWLRTTGRETAREADQYKLAWSQSLRRAEKAEAEVERLRAALAEIDQMPVGAHYDELTKQAEPCDRCGEMRDIARRALEGGA
jgi:hypothetical protein